MATHTFDCSGNRACFSDTLICPYGDDCRVECDGYFSCKKAIVQCAADSTCEIDCTGDEACRELTVYAEAASFLTVNCHTADLQSCSAAYIYCGVNSNSDDITCHVNGITDQNARFTQIYAVDGFSDVEITGKIGSSSPEVTVACGSDYSTHCDISSSTFECAACSDIHSTTTPTTAPTTSTVKPTSAPSSTVTRPLSTSAPSPAPVNIHSNPEEAIIARHSEEADDIEIITTATISSTAILVTSAPINEHPDITLVSIIAIGLLFACVAAMCIWKPHRVVGPRSRENRKVNGEAHHAVVGQVEVDSVEVDVDDEENLMPEPIANPPFAIIISGPRPVLQPIDSVSMQSKQQELADLAKEAIDAFPLPPTTAGGWSPGEAIAAQRALLEEQSMSEQKQHIEEVHESHGLQIEEDVYMDEMELEESEIIRTQTSELYVKHSTVGGDEEC